jgi:RNA polymerase sigma factor (sigma-70 family)
MSSRNPTELNAWFAKEVLVHEPALRGYLNRFFKNVADVEDVVQETYARLLSMSSSTMAVVRNWHAFLFTSARNVALDRIRRARVVSLDALVEMGSMDVLDHMPPADDALGARQELALLLDTVATLPNRCREALTLRKLYGLSQRDIAQRLGITESTVEKLVAYGVRLCAERMFAMRGEPRKPDPSRNALGRKARFDEQ